MKLFTNALAGVLAAEAWRPVGAGPEFQALSGSTERRNCFSPPPSPCPSRPPAALSPERPALTPEREESAGVKRSTNLNL